MESNLGDIKVKHLLFNLLWKVVAVTGAVVGNSQVRFGTLARTRRQFRDIYPDYAYEYNDR